MIGSILCHIPIGLAVLRRAMLPSLVAAASDRLAGPLREAGGGPSSLHLFCVSSRALENSLLGCRGRGLGRCPSFR